MALLLVLVVLSVSAILAGGWYSNRLDLGVGRSLLIFIPWSLALACLGFSAANFWGAFYAAGPDGYPWFMMFAGAGAIASLVLAAVSIGVPALLKWNVRFRAVLLESAGILALNALVSIAALRHPDWNWF